MPPNKPVEVGELRPSQFLHTFGIGATIDLPHLSAIVMGIDDWPSSALVTVVEARLLAEVRARLGAQVERLVLPPAPELDASFSSRSASTSPVGVPVAAFPRFLRCLSCNLLADLRSNLFRLDAPDGRPDRVRYIHTSCSKAQGTRSPTAIPARFLVACPRGHLDDFPWHQFAHGQKPPCNGLVYLEEQGVSGEAVDVRVRCGTCGASRALAEAFGESAKDAIPRCTGRRPQLRDWEPEACPEAPRAMLLGASNAWFGVPVTVLHVPPSAEDELARLVAERWDATLGKVKSRGALEFVREEGRLGPLGDRWDDDAIWRAIEAHRRAATGVGRADVKSPEWQAFTTIDPTRHGRDFLLEEVAPPPAYRGPIARVVLAPRLREVSALLGFSRIESPQDFGTPGDVPSRLRAPISRRAPTFVPSAEVRGEGIFLQLDESRLVAFCSQYAGREVAFRKAHKAWRARRKIDRPESGFPGLRFAVLHSFAHAMMRQLALECGYSAASLRERIYSSEGSEDAPMAGFLLYTAAPDSEGTLGGLVRLGRPESLGHHLAAALEQMRLCSSDPLCAEHDPDADGSTLHGAACHACLFAPETSCERGNKYLDRTLLVGTVRGAGGFFEDDAP